MSTRTETDSFGPIEVPADCYWAAQTQRSIENFPFGARERMPIEIVRALAVVKQAAAKVNRGHGLKGEVADAIEAAAAKVAAGEYDDQFPLVIWQTGSGTQSNMNANEVIAGIANEALTGKRGGKSASPSQRSRQHEPVVQRQFPDRAARCRQHGHRGAIEARTGSPASCARRQGDHVGRHRQDRTRTHLQDATR